MVLVFADGRYTERIMQAALNHVCEFLGVKENLTQMRESLLQSAKEMQGSMDKIDQVAGELRAATTHVKNVGRAIVGKEAQEVAQSKSISGRKSEKFPGNSI